MAKKKKQKQPKLRKVMGTVPYEVRLRIVQAVLRGMKLVDGETILLDVTKTEDRLEIAFHEGAAGRVLDLATLETLVAYVKAEFVDKPI